MMAILSILTPYCRSIIDTTVSGLSGFTSLGVAESGLWLWDSHRVGRNEVAGNMLPRALNHISVPGLRWDDFLALARSLGCDGVEYRNDLPASVSGADGYASVRARARECGLRVLALAEVRAFNDWSDRKRTEAETVMRAAVDCGAEAVILIPRCDGYGSGNGERQANLRVALRELAPMLAGHRLVGLVEPLGFDISSLRHKSEVVDAIESLGLTDRIRLVHDTFHHTLAGRGPIFAAHTGIVHVSGVTDPQLALHEMRDHHRVLVNVRDRLDSAAQVNDLGDAGYAGPVSMEAFAASAHASCDPATDLARSFEFIFSNLADRAA